MKHIIATIFVVCIFVNAHSQKLYTTKSGQIKFNASTAIENIKAVNDQVESRWLENNGQIVITALINGFKFDNQLMQQHFNETYMESSKFSKAEFKGFINEIEHIDLTKAGGYEIVAEGALTLHGVSKKMTVAGILTILSSGKIMLQSDIKIKLKDYNIIGNYIGSKIATDATISVNCMYE